MSRTVDERVVSMEFDNRQFESNVQTSLSTIEKLKQSLKFKDTSKSLSAISDSVKKTDLSPLSNAAQTVGLKFSAMYTIADQAFRNMTNSAIVAGKRIASAFTIEPVKTGMSEYELKMGSIQTIMASTGESLDTVNQYLEELNKYSDQTIYSFQDMTANIGKFTNAGVNLDDAVMAIKGISNEAAVSGANANEASRAMYNFAQALSAGYVKLIDWKSIENANMATVEFKNQLIATAVELGTVKKASDGMYKTLDGHAFNATKNFNEVLNDQWMTTDVLVKTLRDYADETTDIGKKAKNAATEVKTFSQLSDTLKESAQSGWAQTWELIVGDYNESKSLWTNVSNVLGGVIEKSAEARNSLLSGALDSKWEKLTKKINKAGVETGKFEEAVKDVVKTQHKDYDSIIKKYGSLEKAVQAGAISTKTLQTAIGNLSKSMSSADLSIVDKILGKGDKGDQVKQVQQALTDLGYDIGKQFGVDGVIGKYTESAIKSFQEAAGLEVTGIVDEKTLAALEKATNGAVDLGNAVDDIMDGIDQLGGRQLLLESLKNVFEGLKQIVMPAKEAFRDIFPPMTAEKLYNLIKKFHELTEKFKLSTKTTIRLRKVFRGLFAGIDLVWEVVKGVGKAISTVFGGGGSVLAKAGGGVLGFLGKIGDLIVKFRAWLTENNRLTNAFTKLFEGIKKLIGKIKDWFVSLKDIPVVGKLIDKFKDKWKSLEGATNFDKAINGIKNFGSKIKDWFKGFKDLPGVQKNLKKFKEEFAQIKETLKGRWSSGIEQIKAFIDRVKAMDGLSLENIKKAFKDFKENVLGHFFKKEDGTSIFGGLIESIKGLKDKAKEYLESAGIKFDAAKDKIVGFFTAIKEFFSNNAGAFVAIGGLVATIWSIKKVADMVKLIKAPIDMLQDIADGFQSLSNALEKKAKSEAIRNMALAIGILAASVFLLSMIKPGKMWSSIGAIIVLAGALTGLMVVVDKFGDADDFKKVSTSLLYISGAMLIMTLIIKLVSGMKAGELIKGTLVIAGFLGLMIGIMAATKVLAKDMGTFGSTMLKLSAALLILGVVTKMFGKMDTGVLIKGGLAVTAFLGLMVGMMAATRLLGKDASKFGSSMLAMSVGLIAIAFAVKIFAKMDAATLLKGGLIVAGFMTLMSGMMVATRLLGKNAKDMGKFGAMMLAFSGAMLILSASIAILGSMSISKLTQGIAAVAVIGALFGALLIVTRLAKDIKMGTIIGLSAAVAVLAVSIAALSFIDGTKLISATTSLGVVIGMFSVLAMSTKFINTKSIATLLVMGGVITLLAFVIAKLSELPVQSVMGVAGSLSTVLAAVSGSCFVLSKIPIAAAAKGALAFGVFVGIVGALMAGLGLLVSKIDGAQEFINTGIPVLEAVGTGIGSFVGGVLGGLAEGITSTLPAIGTHLSDFATNLQPFFDGISGIDGSLIDSVANLTGALAAITAASVLDSIASFITGTSSIESFSAQLIPFGEAMVSFSDTISGKIDAGAVEAAANAGSMLAAMASTVPNEGGWAAKIMGENDLTTFSTHLIPFGEAMVSFSSIVAGKIDASAVEAAANAGSMITAMADTIPNEGGWAAKIIGDNDLTTFSAHLIPFGEAMVSFSSIVAGKIDAGAIEAAANAGSMVAAMADTIPNEGGWAAKIFGDNDLSTFSSQLSIFGVGIRTFSSQVSGNVDEKAVEAAANAGAMMAAMADTIPNSGGLFSVFAGDNDLATFGAQLVLFGTAMKNFGAEVTGLDTAAVDAAVSAGSAISTMAQTLPESGGLWNVFAKDNDLSTFATQIKSFGRGMKGFSEAVTGIDTTAVYSATSAATSLTTLATTLGSAEKVGNLSTFGNQVKNFGEDLADFSTSIAEVNTVKMATVVRHIGNLATIDLTGLASIGDSLATIGQTSIDSFLDSFENADTNFKNAGIKLLTTLGQGMSSKLASLKTGVTTMINYMVATINEQKDSFSSAGKNMVIGFANGISENVWRAEAKAKAMAKAAEKAAEEALGIASPSKVFYRIGNFTGQGFVKALDNYGRKSYKAGAGMADSARAGLANAIGKVRDVLSGEIGTQPTIRPILDLSDVASGAGSINRMLDVNPSIGVMSNVGAINTSMSRLQNGMSNDDVVKAIKDLGSKMGKMSGDHYSIGDVSYDDNSTVSNAVRDLVRAAQIERRR